VKAMANGRSSAIEHFRSHAGTIFSDIDTTLFRKSMKRSQDPQIRKLLGLSGDPHKDKTPPMLAPVLFEDEDTQSMSKLFRNSALFQVRSIPNYHFLVVDVLILGSQVGRLIVYGPAALNSTKMTHRSDSPYIQDGQFPKATFGFIAWIATMVSLPKIIKIIKIINSL
jgi:hypothetical protein